MPFGRREQFKCIETGDIFDKKQDAASHLNISVSSIHDSLRDGRSHMGYTFVYLSDLDKFDQINEIVRPEGDWYDIPGYEGLYQINKSGDVWSCPRTILRNSGRPNIIRGKILPHKYSCSGYSFVSLTDTNHITKRKSIHRLVAMTFIANPENKPEVNHIDGNKQNNHISNLEWVTRYENQYHAVINGLTTVWTSTHAKIMSDAALKVNNKPVLCVTTGQIFENRVQACKCLGLNRNAVYISIKENRPYKGYMFKEIINNE